MRDKIKIVLTGLNGYGKNCAREILKGQEGSEYELAAVISRNPKKSGLYEQLLQNKVKMYTSLEACLAEETMDLAIITTPMHIHYQEVICALSHDVHVLCEKPLAPTIDECVEIQKLAKEKERLVAVGYQWSYSQAIQRLKQDILAERFGKMKRIKAMIENNRNIQYFTQSDWKGKYQGEDGTYILECLISNAVAHFLHNILFLSGKTLTQSAYPLTLQGEGYKAHEVDGYDTNFLRMTTEAGCELFFAATIAGRENRKSLFQIEFEEGTAYYPNGEEDEVIVRQKDGQEVRYGSPEEGRFDYYTSIVEAIKEKREVACDVETTLPSVIVVNSAIENIPAVRFPNEVIRKQDETLVVEGIEEVLELCYEKCQLPHELGVAWARGSKEVSIKDYRSFTRPASL